MRKPLKTIYREYVKRKKKEAKRNSTYFYL